MPPPQTMSIISFIFITTIQPYFRTYSNRQQSISVLLFCFLPAITIYFSNSSELYIISFNIIYMHNILIHTIMLIPFSYYNKTLYLMPLQGLHIFHSDIFYETFFFFNENSNTHSCHKIPTLISYKPTFSYCIAKQCIHAILMSYISNGVLVAEESGVIPQM